MYLASASIRACLATRRNRVIGDRIVSWQPHNLRFVPFENFVFYKKKACVLTAKFYKLNGVFKR